MRFTIRDLLWLTALAAAGIAWLAAEHRSALLEARLLSADRRIDQLKAHSEMIAAESKTNFATFEALANTVKQADLSEAQRSSIQSLFGKELQRHGVRVDYQY